MKRSQEKSMKDLTDAYTTVWYQRYGAFQTLYCDGEAGLNCDEAKKYLRSLGTTLKTKAAGQHAHYIEARNGILRHTMHLIETDLKRSNIIIPFRRLLGEAIFVANAFTFYNGCSPYNAVFGRQPPCLPDLENMSFEKEGENTDGRREARIRQTAISAIMQTTAESKVKTALRAKNDESWSQEVCSG